MSQHNFFSKDRLLSYEDIGIPIYISDLETKEILYQNGPAVNLFGNITGQYCYNAIHGIDHVCESCAGSKETGEHLITKNRYYAVVDRYFDIHECFIEGETGKKARLCMLVDVTGEQKLKAENKKKEDLLKIQSEFINSSNVMMSAITLEGKFIFINKSMADVTGYSNDELIEHGIDLIHHAETLETITREAIPEMLSGNEWHSDNHIVRKDRTLIPVRQVAFPIKNEAGEVTAFATMIEDITERKKLEDKLEWQSAIIEGYNDYISVADLNGNIAYTNPGGYKMLGYDPSETKQFSISDTISKEYNETIQKVAIPAALRDGKWNDFGELRLKDGSLLPIEQNMFPVFDKDNSPKGIATIIRDVTERRENEKKLEQAIIRAEEASHAKSDFLSRMSHEIRTPMNAIIGMAKIGQSTADADKTQYCLGKISSASKHLLALINDILDMSKIEANKLELVNEPFDFQRALEDICNVVAVKVEEKKQNLFINVDPNVPNEVSGDELRLSQVITNLLSNAVKFTPDAGTINLNVRLKSRPSPDESEILVEVTDTGIGITKEQIKKLFSSFEQAEGNITRRFGGTGLGLVISKRIVELMGGNIAVNSIPDVGSTFYFTVKLKHSEKLSRRRRYDKSVYKNLRVLVIDDSQEILDYFERVLSDFDMSCDLINNGEDAVELAKVSVDAGVPYDIIFVDYLMEGLNGIETTKLIRQVMGNSVNVIMISVAEWSLMEEEANRVGIARFIQKPLFHSSTFLRVPSGAMAK